MRIIEADIAMKEQVNKFYVAQGYHSDWSETERAFVCLVENEVIGSVKVELVHEITILPEGGDVC